MTAADDTDFDQGADVGELSAVDLLLEQGTPAAQDEARARMAAEPMRALEMAETVALLEGFRQLEVEPTDRLSFLLGRVVHRAELLTPAPVRTHWAASITWLLVAAVVAFAVLWSWDPLARRVPTKADAGCARIDGGPGAVAGERSDPVAVGSEDEAPRRVLDVAEAEWQVALEAMRNRLSLETSRRLEQAFEVALLPPADPMQRWLDPRNALASLRADHESRSRPEVRRALLRLQGGLVAVDERVQQLADGIARDVALLAVVAGDEQIDTVALSVRALIAAGVNDAVRSEALTVASEWLAQRLPDCTGVRLARALSPLVEVAAVRGGYGELVAAHGRRLVDEVLRADVDTWGRRRPELLSGAVPVAVLGDTMRLLRLLPGVGVDPARCYIVRELLLGRLRECRDGGDDGPELLAAMLFGGADLLAMTERDDVERELRRWTPLRLAPDFVTVQQLAWGFEPARVGFTRLQRELRRLAVLPDPGQLSARAAFGLCLATGYAAWPGTAGWLADAGD